MDSVVYNICRACLCETENMIPIFIKKDGNELTLAVMLVSLAAVEIEPDDGLPNLICDSCAKLLDVAFNFKQQCKKTDSFLRSNLKNEDVIANNLETLSCDEGVKEIELCANEEIVSAGEMKKSKRKKYKCAECNKIFFRHDFFAKHKKLHECDICEPVVSFSAHKLYQCKLCNRSFKSSHGLSYHTKHHKGIKDYICPYEKCGKKFILKQALEKHKNLHSDEKKHLCNLCGKPYSTYDALHYHLKTHTGERPYLCVHCGKTFKQACHLKNHMWNHTGIKPHVCKTCGKRYTSGHQLKKHLKKYCGVSTSIEELPEFVV